MTWLLQNNTREEMSSRLTPMGIIGVVPELEWPLDADCLGDDIVEALKPESIDVIDLEERGTYMAVYGKPAYHEQVIVSEAQ